MKEYDRLNVSVEKWFEEEDRLEHIYVFSIDKQHLLTLKSILRQMFDHPNTKYSSKLKRTDK